MLQVQDLQLFVQIVHSGSISAAAAHFQLTAAAASAALKRVELHLQTQLLLRTTRSLRLTPAGERFLLHCQNALTALAQAEQEVQLSQREISGEIRLTAPSDLGRHLLLAWLDDFLQQHPAVRLRLELTDKVAGLYKEPVDIALRYGHIQDSSHVAFTLASVPRRVFASPAYLMSHGIPAHPLDLSQHQCVLYLIDDRTFDKWWFQQQGQVFSVNVQGRLISNDAEVVHRWIVKGRGLGLKSVLDMSEPMLQGLVKPLFSDYHGPDMALSMVCANRQVITPAVLALRDFLRERCSAQLAKVQALL
jgi:DNA-binding transcriptional LysR family regulator